MEASKNSGQLVGGTLQNVVGHEIDLRTCKKGDRLLSKHGLILTYEKPLETGNYMDHEVVYPDGSLGTRTHNGQVFRKRRLPEDHDIVEILPNPTGQTRPTDGGK